MYALHSVSRILDDNTSAQLAKFDRDFLNNLRVEHLPPEFSEVSGLNVHNFQIDHIRIYFYPSQILGIASAYHSVDLKQRAEAQAWLTSISDDILKARNIAIESPWIAAEYLIAINLLLNK